MSPAFLLRLTCRGHDGDNACCVGCIGGGLGPIGCLFRPLVRRRSSWADERGWELWELEDCLHCFACGLPCTKSSLCMDDLFCISPAQGGQGHQVIAPQLLDSEVRQSLLRSGELNGQRAAAVKWANGWSPGRVIRSNLAAFLDSKHVWLSYRPDLPPWLRGHSSLPFFRYSDGPAGEVTRTYRPLDLLSVLELPAVPLGATQWAPRLGWCLAQAASKLDKLWEMETSEWDEGTPSALFTRLSVEKHLVLEAQSYVEEAFDLYRQNLQVDPGSAGGTRSKLIITMIYFDQVCPLFVQPYYPPSQVGGNEHT